MSIPTQIAETVQTAHIQRAPSPHHDANPSTSASAREPVRLSSRRQSRRDYHPGPDEDVVADSDDESDIPVSVLRPHRRRQSFPPMPDLRFEQSYLHSIEGAQSWGKIAWITVRDQVRSPSSHLPLHTLSSSPHLSPSPCPLHRTSHPWKGNPIDVLLVDHDAPRPGRPVQPGHMRLAVLEPQRAVQREHGGRPAQAVVVRGEQLEDSPKGQEVVRIVERRKNNSIREGIPPKKRVIGIKPRVGVD